MLRGKKGSSQVDWVISLSLFLLYLAWYFIFLKPQLEDKYSLAPLAGTLEDRVHDELYWSVDRIPLRLSTNVTGAYHIVELDVPYNWTRDYILLPEDLYFQIEGGRMLMLANLTAGDETLWLMHSDEPYNHTGIVEDIIAEDSYVSLGSVEMRVDYEDMMPNKVEYRDRPMVYSIEYALNGSGLSIQFENFSITPIYAKYWVATPQFNHTSRVYARNSKVVNEIALNDVDTPYSLSFSLELQDFDYYFANNRDSGLINYTKQGCRTFTSPFMDFYDSLGGLAFLFSSDADFRFCFTNSSDLNLNITWPLEEGGRYNIIPHDGDYLDVSQQFADVAYEFGLLDAEEGLSLQLIEDFSQRDYEDLKDDWNIPGGVQLVVYNSTLKAYLRGEGDVLLDYSPETPKANTQAESVERNAWVIDKYGNLSIASYKIRVW